MTTRLADTRALGHQRTAVAIVMALVAARWLAGAIEHLGPAGLSEYVALLMIGGLALLFLVHLRLSQRGAPLIAGLLAMLFAAQLSLAANDVAEPAKAHNLSALLCLYALAAHGFFLHLANPNGLRALRWFFIAFLWVAGGLALLQINLGYGFVDPARAHLIRAVGSDVHPVSFAMQIVIAAVGLRVTQTRLALSLRWFGWVALSLGGLALYLTFARTAWAMAAVVLCFVLITQGRLIHRAFWVVIIASGSAAMIGYSDRFADLGSLPFFLQSFDWHNIVFDHRYIDNSVSWRIVNWGYGMQQALMHPWLGIGPGQSALASTFGREMHNLFLELFLEGGIIGMTALAFVIWGLVRLHRAVPKATISERKARRYTTALGLALLAASTFSTSLVDQLMTVLLYFLVLAGAQSFESPKPNARPNVGSSPAIFAR